MPLSDEAVVKNRPSMTQSEQRLGVAVLLQQDIIHCWKSILQVPERSDVGADPLSDLDNGPRILDDSPQLHRNDVVDDGIDQPDPPAEPIEDGRFAHFGGCGDLLERCRKPLLPENLRRRMPDPVDVSAGIRPQSWRASRVGHDAGSFRIDD